MYKRNVLVICLKLRYKLVSYDIKLVLSFLLYLKKTNLTFKEVAKLFVFFYYNTVLKTRLKKVTLLCISCRVSLMKRNFC